MAMTGIGGVRNAGFFLLLACCGPAGHCEMEILSRRGRRDTIHSPEGLQDPYGNKATISPDFLRIPLLAAVITDTHFAARVKTSTGTGGDDHKLAATNGTVAASGSSHGIYQRPIHNAMPRSGRRESRGAPASSRPAG